MAVTTLFIAAPGDDFRTTAVRPEFQVRWTDGVGSFDVLHEWDTVNTFNSGNLITDNNTSVTSPDNGVPPSDMSVGAWFYRATITDNNDAQQTASSIYDVEILDEDDLLQFLYLNTNVGPGYIEGVDGDPKSFSRFLYLQGEIIAGIPVPFITSITPSSVDQLDTITIRGNGFDNVARDWEAVARLYDNPDPQAVGATFVALPEVSFSAGATEDIMVVTIPAGAPSGWVCVLNDADTGAPIVYQYSNTKKLLVAQGTPDADAGWRFEGVDHENNTVLINDWSVAKGDFHQVMNDIGNGSIYLPAGDRVSEWVEPYVTFTGTTGHLATVPEGNITPDADSANLVQSIGLFNQNSLGGGSSVSIVDAADAFGGKALRAVMGSGVSNYFRWNVDGTNGLGYVPIQAGQTTDFACRIRGTEGAGKNVTINLHHFDVTGARTGQGALISAHPLTDEWQIITATKSNHPAGTEYISLEVNVSAMSEGDEVWVDWVQFTPIDTAFVGFEPSMRIVKDIDLRARAAISSSATGENYLMSVRTGNGGWMLGMDAATNNRLFARHGDGTNQRTGIDQTGQPASDVPQDLRAVYDESAGSWNFYLNGAFTHTYIAGPSGDAAGWTFPLYIASTTASGSLFDGDIYWLEVRDGEDGPVVFRFDAADVRNAVGQSV